MRVFAGRRAEASRVVQRVKLMKQELANVEAAGGADAVAQQQE